MVDELTPDQCPRSSTPEVVPAEIMLSNSEDVAGLPRPRFEEVPVFWAPPLNMQQQTSFSADEHANKNIDKANI